MSVYNKPGLRLLKGKADAFRDDRTVQMLEIPTFYRNKPSSYFQEIEEKYDNVMYPYRKDKNGDTKCPANGRIRGLFFMGRREQNNTSFLPSYFIFGNKRVIVPAHLILNSDSRLYFCDFWCHRSQHYTTVVVTRSGTKEDDFCQDYLLELEKSNNSYLELRGDNVYINQNIWVEILFTDKLDLKTDGIDWDTGINRVQSRINGMEKKKFYSTCSLRDVIPIFGGAQYLREGPTLIEDTFSINRVPERPEFMRIKPAHVSEEPTSVAVTTSLPPFKPILTYEKPASVSATTSLFGSSLVTTKENSAENTPVDINTPGLLSFSSQRESKKRTISSVLQSRTLVFGRESEPMPKKRSLESDTDEPAASASARGINDTPSSEESDDEPSAKKSSLETDEDEPETSDKNKDFLRF